ncbi:hypothetical protein [Polluticoccus soli]|uniref:hypothetical protein n=1 Tax=Polluticoccus soli TaxID=3034150 RepID=UPI0023E2ADB5|nr:hypothetical protein [Flavipsychrobacter sp. JY13-12]
MSVAVRTFAGVMDLRILFVLILFMAMFFGGGILIIRGALTRNYRQIYIGLGLFALMIVFLLIVKNMKGLY